MRTEGERIAAALDDREPLTRFDWARALVVTEIVFISDIFGSGHDWQNTTRFSDEQTLSVLRPLQVKLLPVFGGLRDTAFDRRRDR